MNKKEQVIKKVRKSWKVDLKWIFGILATILLTISLISFAVYRVASNPEVEKVTKPDSNFLKNMIPEELQGKTKGTPGQSDFKINVKGKWYSPKELDNLSEGEAKELFGGEIEKFMNPQKSNAQMPGIPGMPGIGGSEGDLEKALAGKDFEKIGEQMFGNMMNQAIMPAIGSAFIGPVKGASLTIFLITLIPALLFLVLMVVFSYRWGHLLSFAVVLLLASVPVFMLATLFKIFGTSTAPKSPDVFAGAFSLVDVIANSNFALFLGIIIFAVLLIGLSGLGSIITLATKPKPKKQQPQPPIPAAPKAA